MTLLAALLLAPPLAPQATDTWPEYRGPNHDGRAEEAAVPLRWSEEEAVRWKTAVPGRAWSSPVIWGDQIWFTTASNDGHRMGAMCVSLETGEVVHALDLLENEEPEERNSLNSYASPSPSIEDGRLYVHFGTYGTFAIDTESAEVVWERTDLHCDHMEGPGSSPLLHGEHLYLNYDGGDVQFVVALDKDSGETVWTTEREADLERFAADLRKAYSTPLMIEVDGAEQLISSGAQATVAYDPVDGSELWRVHHGGFSMSSRPVLGDGMIYLNTGFMRPELWAVRLGGEGLLDDDQVAWKRNRAIPTMPSPVLVDGMLFLVDDGGIASCLDALSGEELWRKRVGGQSCASPVYAGGRIYFFDRDGKTTVVAPEPDYRELATNELDEGFMASPAIVGDALILRTSSHLYRIEAPAER